MSTRFQELHMDQLVVHPKNVRRNVGNVVELANSISSQGILQPLVVAPDLTQRPDGEKISGEEFRYIIVAGHRRHAAAKLANVDTLPCVIRTDINTEPKQFEAMLVENTQRTDLTIMEEARAYQSLLDFPGYTVKKVAKNIGRSQHLVKDRAKLAGIDQRAADKLDAKQMTLEEALIFAEFADDEAATTGLLNDHGTYNWRWRVQREREARSAKEAITNNTVALKALGAEIIERPEDLNFGACPYVRANIFSDFEGWDDAQHAAAGHVAVVDVVSRGATQWLVARHDAPEIAHEEEPVETEEQAAARRRIEELNAGLQIAAHVRREHLKAAFLVPTDEVLEHVRKSKIDSLVNTLTHPLVGDFFDLPEDSTKADLREALAELTRPQLDALSVIAGRSYEERELEKVGGWGPTSYGSDYSAKHRKQITELFGYTLSDIEREAVQHITDLRSAETAETADEDQEEEDYDDE
jgi:ParB family chromosome partitioning protein